MHAALNTLNNKTSLLYEELLLATMLTDSVRSLSSNHGSSLMSGNENRNLPIRLKRRRMNWYEVFTIDAKFFVKTTIDTHA
jgi:hypothetical protein